MGCPPALLAIAALTLATNSSAGSWALVLASKESAEEATAALAELREPVTQWLSPAEGYPRVVDSATVQGFRPGFQVVVLGYCASKDVAKRLAEWAKLEAPQAYFKRVNESIPGACPELRGRKTAMFEPRSIAARLPRPRWCGPSRRSAHRCCSSR